MTAISPSPLAILTGAVCLLQLLPDITGQNFGQKQLMYEWNRLEFDWPSEAAKQAAIADKTYVPGRSMLAGIKVHKNDVFVTMPRWRWPEGIPVVLAKIISRGNSSILSPYPNWAAQKQGDCNALQYVQSMEIDPSTGLMYVIDTGMVAMSIPVCTPKIVIYDLKTNTQVDKHEFPSNVVNGSSCFLNDIVLDYVEGEVKNVYITNTFENTIVIYDTQKKTSYKIHHSTLGLEGNGAENITINNQTYTFPMAVNGIAMSPDFKYVYYSSLAGFNLHQIPTTTLRGQAAGTTGIRVVGRKMGQTDGMAHGQQRLYYGAIGLSSVYFWDKKSDLESQKAEEGRVEMRTQTFLAGSNTSMEWPDTFAFDEQGWIWVVACRLQVYWGMDALPENSTDPFLRIWKVYVNETSYLHGAREGTSIKETTTRSSGNGASGVYPRVIAATISACLLLALLGGFVISRKILI